MKNGWKGHLIGGWQIAPNIRVVSGAPLNTGNEPADTIADNSLTGSTNANATFESFVPGCSPANAYSNGLQNGYSWLNQSCFLETVNTNATGTAQIAVNPVYTNTVLCTGTAAGNTCPAGTTGVEYANATSGSGQFGNISRNLLRAPGAETFDLSISRMFPIHERLQAEFRFDVFNVFNHWNPVAPSGGSPTGTSGTQTYGYITSAATAGVLPTQWDPRVLQFALKFQF
jgi:hypothetical protein